MHIGKKFFSLFEHTRMTNVVHVEDTIGINANRVFWVQTEVFDGRPSA